MPVHSMEDLMLRKLKIKQSSYIKKIIFDRIGMLGTNGVSITNNVIYNTFRTGIAVTGKNNIIQKNLVTTIYWSGTAQSSSIADYNTNYDGAIMSRDAVSVIMQVGHVQ